MRMVVSTRSCERAGMFITSLLIQLKHLLTPITVEKEEPERKEEHVFVLRLHCSS